MENSLFLDYQEQEKIGNNSGLQLELSHFVNINKQQIAQISSDAIELVAEGHSDALKLLIVAKKGIELFSGIEKSVRPYAEDQIKLAKGETYNKFNVSIGQAEQGVKYNYAACNDLIWNQLAEDAKAINEALKERETFLKAVSKKMTVVNENSGETWEINPPIRTGKTGLTLKVL